MTIERSVKGVSRNVKLIVEQMDKLCVDYGLVDEKGFPVRPGWMKEIVANLRDLDQRVKARAKELIELREKNRGQVP